MLVIWLPCKYLWRAAGVARDDGAARRLLRKQTHASARTHKDTMDVRPLKEPLEIEVS